MIRGAVYKIDLGTDKRGREQQGKRLGIAMSQPPTGWSTVTVVPTSTSASAAIFRPELVIAGRETLALVDQIRSIDIGFVLGEPVDVLTHADLAQVDYALGRWLGLSVNLNI
ncbi:type II toxin-antitoxin system PemK/MazF family toxin [Streptomyces sp. NPDC055189]